MQILIDKNIDRNKWINLLSNSVFSSPFQTPEFYAFYNSVKGYTAHVFAVEEEGELISLVIVTLQKENGIKSFFSRRAIIYGGPLIIGNENTPKVLTALFTAIDNKIKHKVIYTEIRNQTVQSDSIIEEFKKLNYEYVRHLNILVDTTIGTDLLWKNVKRNRKDGINKAKKQGFVFEVLDDISLVDSFYSLLEETYNNKKIPYPPKEYFANLLLYNKGYFKWFILSQKGIPIVILAALIYNRTIYAYYIGISKDKDITILRPVDLFYWEIIKYASLNDYAVFDWLGAGKPDEEYGVREFKIQYGGNILEMGRYLKIHNRLLYLIGLFGLKLIQRLK